MLEDFYFGPHESSPDDEPQPAGPGALPGPAVGSAPPPATGTATLRQIMRTENVAAAWDRVRRNRGCAGVDRQSIAALEPCFATAWEKTAATLHAGTWRPRPLLRVAIPKCNGGTRLLGIPTVMDRVVAQALAQVLGPPWEQRFSPYSFAYRRGRSTLDALHHVRGALSAGATTCLHLDIANFFDTIPHAPLLDRVAGTPCGGDCMGPVSRLLKAPIFECGSLIPSCSGVAQGSPLSPLLANITLDPLDHWLTARGVTFARYADDILITARTADEAASLRPAIAAQLHAFGLSLNEQKTKLTPPDGAEFLGYTFWRDNAGTCRLAVSPAALDACRQHLRQLTGVAAVERFLASWRAYFGHSERPSDWQEIIAFAQRECGLPADRAPHIESAATARRGGVNYAGQPASPPRPVRAGLWHRVLHFLHSSPVRVALDTAPGTRPFIPRLRGFRITLCGHVFRFRR